MLEAYEVDDGLSCDIRPYKLSRLCLHITSLATFISASSCIFYDNAMATSFNCNRASTYVERLICSSKTLSRMDDQLAVEFFKAKRIASDERLLSQDERNWLKRRNNCVTETCLVQEYSIRLEQIRGSILSNTPPDSVSQSDPVKRNSDNQSSGSVPIDTNIALKNAQTEVDQANQHAFKVCEDLHLPAEQLIASGTLNADGSISFAKDKALQAARISEESCRTKFREAKEKNEADQSRQAADQKEADARELASASVEGQKYAEQYGIRWNLSTKKDEMTDGKTLVASSDQTSDDNAVQAQVTLTCSSTTKNLDMRAMFFDEKGGGVDLLDTSRPGNEPAVVHVKTRYGSDAEISDQFLPIGDFRNEIRLTGNPLKQAMQGQLSLLGNIYGQSLASALSRQSPGGLSEADTLLRRSRILFQVKTTAGEVVLKVLPYDPNVLPVVKACVSSPNMSP